MILFQAQSTNQMISYFQTLLTRLNALRLTVSSSRLLRKMDDYGSSFDKMLVRLKERGNESLKQQNCPGQNASSATEQVEASVSLEETHTTAVTSTSADQELNSTPVVLSPHHTVLSATEQVQVSSSFKETSCAVLVEQHSDSIPSPVSHPTLGTDKPVNVQLSGATYPYSEIPTPYQQMNSPFVSCRISEGHCSAIANSTVEPKCGFSIVVDNWDMRQEVRHMSSDHQNTDIHWVNHNIVENRVSGNHLADDRPIMDVADVQNKDLIPSMADHKALYDNYLVHIQRILVKRIPALQCLGNHVPKHIKHRHSEEMSKQSKKVLDNNAIVLINHIIISFC